MTDRYFSGGFKGTENLSAARPGYKVIHPDGLISWPPDETFKAIYHEIPYLIKKKGVNNVQAEC